MFGCLRRIVVLFVLCVAALAAYLTRDRWIGYVPWLKSAPRTATTAADGAKWEPVSDDGAARARQAIESLGKKSGPVFVSLDPGDLASYFYIALAQQLPPSADSIEATTIGSRMYHFVISLEKWIHQWWFVATPMALNIGASTPVTIALAERKTNQKPQKIQQPHPIAKPMLGCTSRLEKT